MGIAIARLVKASVLLKAQRAVQRCPREEGTETYTLSRLQYLTPVDFTETKTYNTTEDLGPMRFGKAS